MFRKNMVTYNDLYEYLRKERYSEELQALPKKFINEVFEYFGEKKKFSDKSDDMFSDVVMKTKKKLENSMAIFKELLTRRKKKILNLAFVASETGISKRDFENLLGFEKDLFEEIVKSLEKADKNLNASMVGTREDTNNFLLARFLVDVEEFLGLDGESIGPFKKGEIANLDKEIVDILSKDGKVEVLAED
jgi:DNA replication initiation complex subunit (GINS family)